MRKLFGSIALALVLVAPAGCCTTRNSETQVSVESYVAALERIKTNLTDDVRPGYAEALSASGVIPELQGARLGVLDDTLTLINDTLTGAAEAPAEDAETPEAPAEGGGE